MIELLLHTLYEHSNSKHLNIIEPESKLQKNVKRLNELQKDKKIVAMELLPLTLKITITWVLCYV